MNKARKKNQFKGRRDKKVARRPITSISSKIRQVGNSKGVILTRELIDSAGISENADILIEAHNGSIIIIESKTSAGINTNLSTWDQQFKKAIAAGKTPEKDLFERIENRFDQEEWT